MSYLSGLCGEVMAMGVYFNPGNYSLREARNSKIYVDKNRLLEHTNSVIGTLKKYICVSRPRRFGKTMAARMLAAYYSKGCDSAFLFDDLAIASSPNYTEHRNKYSVIFINTLRVWSQKRTFAAMKSCIEQDILRQLICAFPGVSLAHPENLVFSLEDVFAQTGERFIFIIDEWDCLVREAPEDKELLRSYLHFLRDLLKDEDYVALAYITGILPVRKYGSQSALNMFKEYTMTNPHELAEFVGFTDAEVQSLCQQFGRNYEKIKHWYDGYTLGDGLHIYSPCSVVQAIEGGDCDNYWTSTESFESLRQWLKLDFDGLRAAVIKLLNRERIFVDITCFNNSFNDLDGRDAVLGLLVHLGYLGFKKSTQEVFIPNQEIAEEFARAIKGTGWKEIAKALQESLTAINAVWDLDGEEVARIIQNAHYETSVLDYNNEKALRYTVLFAFYTARGYYNVVQECPTGKGFADIVYLPNALNADKPALVIELKWNKDANTAIKQIKETHYLQALEGYVGRVLLVGISYDKDSKEHECTIEEVMCSE